MPELSLLELNRIDLAGRIQAALLAVLQLDAEKLAKLNAEEFLGGVLQSWHDHRARLERLAHLLVICSLELLEMLSRWSKSHHCLQLQNERDRLLFRLEWISHM